MGSKVRKELFGNNRQCEWHHLGVNWGRLGSGEVKEGEKDHCPVLNVDCVYAER